MLINYFFKKVINTFLFVKYYIFIFKFETSLNLFRRTKTNSICHAVINN